MARIRYQKSSKGTVELMTSAEMLALMMTAAERGKGFAEEVSPKVTGDYAGNFRTEGVKRGGPRKDRAECLLINDADYATAVELRHAVLGHTVDFIKGVSGA